MATTLTYSTQPISTRVDPRGRYYARIEAPALTAEESLRDIMAYKKINAYSASTVLQLLNDLLQGAVELTAIDGRTRILGQMLRIYMALEGSYADAVLSPADKSNLKVRTQLLKDMKYPVNAADFTLSPKESIMVITGIHYSGQENNEDAAMIGTQMILTGRNLDRILLSNEDYYYECSWINRDTGAAVTQSFGSTSYTPSYGALLTNGPTANTAFNNVFSGSGPWNATLRIAGGLSAQAGGDGSVEYLASRNCKIYPAAT